MIRIDGPSFDDLDPQIEACEKLVMKLCRQIMSEVAQDIGHVRIAAAEPVPPPEEPPGEPLVSLDTLAVIATLWAAAVLADLVPFIGDIWDFGASRTRSQINQAVPEERSERIPSVDAPATRTLAEDYLANAPSRVSGFSDEMWQIARAQLLEGFMEGESIDKLRDRLRLNVPALSAARARTIARTEVISASNAGSLAMVEIAGFTGKKGWLATEDERTRPTHRQAEDDYQDSPIPLGDSFIVGGFPLHFPGDPTGPPEEIINCRCTMTYELDDEPLTAAGGAMTGEWIGVLLKEGVFTGDQRMFAPGAVDFAEFPMPLRWQIFDDEGHKGSVIVGNITSAVRQGDLILGRGVFDLNGQYGAEAYRMVKEGFLYGVSIDADDFIPSEVEYVYGAGPMGTEDSMVIEKTIYHGGRLRASTLCAIPAFVEARISLMSPDGEEMASMPYQVPITAAAIKGAETTSINIPEQRTFTAGTGITLEQPLEPITAASYTLTIPDVPPAEWFQEPTDVEMHGALTVTDEGRVYGWLAPADVEHRSFKERVTVPMGNVDYSRWLKGETIVAGGGRVLTGVLTMDCGHASMGIRDPSAAMDHYDNSCSVFANVVIGERPGKGTWIAGSVVPGVTASHFVRAMGCVLSGDWRPHKKRQGWREFTAALLVPVPGFAMARTQPSVRVEDGELVASSIPVEFVRSEEDFECGCSAPASDLASDFESLAASLGLDLGSRMQALAKSVEV